MKALHVLLAVALAAPLHAGSFLSGHLKPLLDAQRKITIHHMPLTLKSESAVAPPVLTGAEAYTIEAFRESLRGRHPVIEITTAQQVIDLLDMAEAAKGNLGVAGELEMVDLGRSLLTVNWVHAVILGRAEEADTLRGELDKLVSVDGKPRVTLAHFIEARNTSNTEAFGDFPNWTDQHSHGYFALATAMNGWHRSLPDSVDPQGYLRQRLQGLSERYMAVGNYFWSIGY
ncbi:MAG: hypothetical protein OXB98_03710 [Bryobacterales bacterium]|nr:hypothetical protein [Bryobacterales bacterium]